MQKKFYPIIIVTVLAVLVIGGGIFAFFKLQPSKIASEPTQTVKKKITLPFNVIALADRPLVSIEPQADGRNIVIGVAEVRKDALEAEYELEYQAGTLLQGAANVFSLNEVPTTQKILLGSCSAGGACTYHEDVKGGTMIMTFSGGAEPYALKSDWKYWDNKAKETEVSSRDAKFQLSSQDLARQRYLIVFNAFGVPGKVPGTAVSSPYNLSSSGTLTGSGKLTLRTNEDGGTTIIGWDGSAWKEFPTTVNGKELTATVDLLPLYLAIKK